MAKHCTKCKELKTFEFYNADKSKSDGLSCRCKQCVHLAYKQHRKKNHCLILEKEATYRNNNREYCRLNVKKAKVNNKSKVQAYNKEYVNRIRQNPEKRLQSNIRSRVSGILKKRCNLRSSMAVEFLGCSLSFFKEYIESQFKDGMTWENYGRTGWHVDHITPISKSNNIDEFKKLSHYTNLQPMWATDNLRKGNKIL